MVTYKQDTAPSGGYGPFEWAKRAPKKLFTGRTQIAIFFAWTALGWTWFLNKRSKKSAIELEMRDARIAIEPFMLAERDRINLKAFRKNRDEENELMKDVPGWKTGTLWGEPVYHNLRDIYIEPSLFELVAHMSDKDKKSFFNEGWNHGWFAL